LERREKLGAARSLVAGFQLPSFSRTINFNPIKRVRLNTLRHPRALVIAGIAREFPCADVNLCDGELLERNPENYVRPNTHWLACSNLSGVRYQLTPV
jgi:hypothetical protein